jgi:hypothetical protein
MSLFSNFYIKQAASVSRTHLELQKKLTNNIFIEII